MFKWFRLKNRRAVVLLILLIGGLVSCGGNDRKQSESYTSTGVSDTTSTAKSESFSSDTDTSSTSPNDTKKDWLLVPGISAGQTKIDENAEEVYKRLGTPDGGDAAMQKAIAVWYSNHDSTANSIAIYTARNTDGAVVARVLQIRITSPSFTTKEGIQAGSSLSGIQSKFTVKQTETYKDAGANYKVYDSKKGIAFEVNDDEKCVAIIIHKAGVIGEGTYLKFRTTNKFIDRKK